MNATELLLGRRSIRKYKPELVSKEDINAIMEEARYTQSWGNTQTARFTFVQNPEIIKKIGEEGVQDFVYNVKTLKYAQNVLVLSYMNGFSGKFDKDEYVTSKGNQWEMFDAGIACQTFALAAYGHGVGTCVMGVIDDRKIAQIIGLPDNQTVAALVTFGYPNEEGRSPSRHDLDELCTFL